MEINIWAVIACGVVAMVIGAIWYGPIFGKKWMEICGATNMDVETRKKMQKEAMPLYGIQFILALFQAHVLAVYIMLTPDKMSGMSNSLWIWAAFIMPTVAAAAMWNNDAKKVKWARFLIQAGCQLVTFIVFALILTAWK